MADIGIILTGQSLAIGGGDEGGDSSLLTPLYPEQCFMLSPNPIGIASETLSNEIVPLKEREGRHTIGHSFTRKIAESNPNIRVVFHGQGQGGKEYAALKKGGETGVCEKIIAQVTNVKANMPSIIYKYLCIIHGEQDGNLKNTNYTNNLIEWLSDFNADVKAITEQAENLKMLLCQTNSASGYGNVSGISSSDFPSALLQLKAHEENENIFLVTPKYFLPYRDHAHITNIGDRILGEYYGKAYLSIETTGTWEPLRPISLLGMGDKITVTFAGNVGQLVFDTTLVQPATNYGFEYMDSKGRQITNVEIKGINQVEITLDGDMGYNAWLSYAYQNGLSGDENQAAGLGERGNLRDSDTAVSVYDGAPLYNWCVTFKKQVKRAGIGTIGYEWKKTHLKVVYK